jgi:predicted DNA-binding transcriptional regulator YafY
MSGKVQPKKIRIKPVQMNQPAMMDWALRLLRLLNEKKVLTSRVVAEEFDVNIRTAQRYLLYLSDLPCVVADEEKHTYTLTSDYVITDKILPSEWPWCRPD